jgi:O-antigen/teichoic acid export membrane protein
LGLVARSSALRTALIYGSAGAAFAAANLLLARVLPVADYAIVALVLAFFNFAIPMGPLGADAFVNRAPTRVGVLLLARAIGTALIAACVAAFVARVGYDVSGMLLFMIFAAVLAGGTGYLAAAHFQSQRRFTPSLAIIQGANAALLAAALLTALTPWRSALACVAVLTAWYVGAALLGWRHLFRTAPSGDGSREGIPWREALTLAGVSGSTLLLVQLERFAAPLLLDLGALATLGVLAAIVGSVFRILLLSVGFSLLPRLRAATTQHERRGIVAHEALAVGGVVITASVGLWLITPWLVDWLLASRYRLPATLVAAALAAGWLRVASAFTRTVVVALGSKAELARLNAAGWAAVVIAVAGMAVGAQWGLTGLVLGAGAGWLALLFVAGTIAVPLMGAGRRPQA